ncbi:MAG: hypothetical protein JKX94_03865 [Sneathiella sp.]|nr:hypothetical protein [Sneathiella sp.]
MVDVINSGNSVYAAQYAVKAYHPEGLKDITGTPEAQNPAVDIELSENGEKVKNLVGELVPVVYDPAIFLQKGETRLKDLMEELNIPEETEMDIRRNADGTYSVTGDHPQLSKIEEKLNDGSEADLANSLSKAHSGTGFQHVIDALGMAARGAEENPQMAENYFEWLRSTVQPEANSMDFSISYKDGSLSGSLLDSAGNDVAVGKGWALPVT